MTHTQKILNEMCQRVGAKNIDFKKEGWFLKHTWTQKEQDDFIEWLTEYLKNKEAVQELTGKTYTDKAWRAKIAREFIFNFGWKNK